MSSTVARFHGTQSPCHRPTVTTVGAVDAGHRIDRVTQRLIGAMTHTVGQVGCQ